MAVQDDSQLGTGPSCIWLSSHGGIKEVGLVGKGSGQTRRPRQAQPRPGLGPPPEPSPGIVLHSRVGSRDSGLLGAPSTPWARVPSESQALQPPGRFCPMALARKERGSQEHAGMQGPGGRAGGRAGRTLEAVWSLTRTGVPGPRQSPSSPCGLRMDPQDKRTFPFPLRESAALHLYDSTDFERPTRCNLVATLRAVNIT